MKTYKILLWILFYTSCSLSATAQQTALAKLVQERGGIPIPHNKTDLKIVSLLNWYNLRNTRNNLYSYVTEAAAFHSFLTICKRNKLNVNMDTLVNQAIFNIKLTVPANYDDPEYSILDTMTKPEQNAFLDDMASDVYAYEFGWQTASLEETIKKKGTLIKEYCDSQEVTNSKRYIALYATAKRRLEGEKAKEKQ